MPYCFLYEYQLQNLLAETELKYKSKEGLNIFREVFLNRWAAARYRALASIISGRERPEETTICHVPLINNLNVILYLSTCHTVYISVLILFMIMP
jgi:hypothetical protein